MYTKPQPGNSAKAVLPSLPTGNKTLVSGPAVSAARRLRVGCWVGGLAVCASPFIFAMPDQETLRHVASLEFLDGSWSQRGSSVSVGISILGIIILGGLFSKDVFGMTSSVMSLAIKARNSCNQYWFSFSMRKSPAFKTAELPKKTHEEVPVEGRMGHGNFSNVKAVWYCRCPQGCSEAINPGTNRPWKLQVRLPFGARPAQQETARQAANRTRSQAKNIIMRMDGLTLDTRNVGKDGYVYYRDDSMPMKFFVGLELKPFSTLTIVGPNLNPRSDCNNRENPNSDLEKYVDSKTQTLKAHSNRSLRWVKKPVPTAKSLLQEEIEKLYKDVIWAAKRGGNDAIVIASASTGYFSGDHRDKCMEAEKAAFKSAQLWAVSNNLMLKDDIVKAPYDLKHADQGASKNSTTALVELQQRGKNPALVLLGADNSAFGGYVATQANWRQGACDLSLWQRVLADEVEYLEVEYLDAKEKLQIGSACNIQVGCRKDGGLCFYVATPEDKSLDIFLKTLQSLLPKETINISHFLGKYAIRLSVAQICQLGETLGLRSLPSVQEEGTLTQILQFANATTREMEEFLAGVKYAGVCQSEKVEKKSPDLNSQTGVKATCSPRG